MITTGWRTQGTSNPIITRAASWDLMLGEAVDMYCRHMAEFLQDMDRGGGLVTQTRLYHWCHFPESLNMGSPGLWCILACSQDWELLLWEIFIILLCILLKKRRWIADHLRCLTPLPYMHAQASPHMLKSKSPSLRYQQILTRRTCRVVWMKSPPSSWSECLAQVAWPSLGE